MTLIFTTVTSKNDVTLCKINVTAVAGSVDFIKLEQKHFNGKSIASSSLKIKCGKSKGMQEKVFIVGVWCG